MVRSFYPPPPGPPLSNSAATFNRYLKLILKAIRKGKKSTEGFEITIEPGISRREGCALTNCAKPSVFLLAKAPCCYFYSPQTSCLKSKMAATIIQTKTSSFRPPKTHLHCSLLGVFLKMFTLVVISD